MIKVSGNDVGHRVRESQVMCGRITESIWLFQLRSVRPARCLTRFPKVDLDLSPVLAQRDDVQSGDHQHLDQTVDRLLIPVPVTVSHHPPRDTV